ncbi:MAG: ABC transporter permease [Candidatus Schekmanbacteria bacterium]|nr:ABC transporter permease [Candidatus Schekmanbacteria bacterium]
MRRSGLATSRALREFRRNRVAQVGAAILLALFAIAALAPVLAPEGIDVQHRERERVRPCREYPLGTDELGRDQLSRLIWGSRVSLRVGFVVVAVSAVIGIALGGVAGYFGGAVDGIVMRVTDVLMAFPGILLALSLVAMLGPSFRNVVLALCALGWVRYARMLRGQILLVRELDFVTAARSLGASDWRVLSRHVLPNCLAPLIVEMSLGVAGAILAEATLSFLGLGVQPPEPSWGAMLNRGIDYLRDAPHLTLFPGGAIMLTVLALNVVGDALRDALDPHSAK